MANWRILRSAVSLSITMLLWPSASPAGPKSCAELMKELYEQVGRLDLHDSLQNEMKKASVHGRAQEYIKENLPALKAACPTEANSIKDLENGNYLKKLEAQRKRQKKAHRHVKDGGIISGGPGEDRDLEDLEIQR